MPTSKSSIWLLWLGILGLCAQMLSVAWNWRWYQYDFRAYYAGPKLMLEGWDPYSLVALEQLSTRLGLENNNHPFLYPPHVLFLFAPLAMLPYPAAYGLWLALQGAAIAAIVYFARRAFSLNTHWLVFMLAFGLNGTVAACLRSGQLSLIEGALVLAALASLKRNQTGRFGVLIVLGALAKVWSAIFLAMAPVKQFVRGGLVAAGAAAMLGATLLLDELCWPEYSASFKRAVAALPALGHVNGPQDACLLNLLNSLFGQNTAAATLIWLALALTIVGVTVRSCLLELEQDRTSTEWIAPAALACFLVLPRAMIYQWCVILPIAVYVLSRVREPTVRYGLVAAMLMPTVYIRRYLFGLDVSAPAGGLTAIWSFSNVLVVAVLWASAIHPLRIPMFERKLSALLSSSRVMGPRSQDKA